MFFKSFHWKFQRNYDHHKFIIFNIHKLFQLAPIKIDSDLKIILVVFLVANSNSGKHYSLSGSNLDVGERSQTNSIEGFQGI